MTKPDLKVAASAEIKIEKSVPLANPDHKGPPTKYPWKSMEVGDSFLVPTDVRANTVYRNSAQACLRYAPKKFITRKTSEGFRVWRTA